MTSSRIMIWRFAEAPAELRSLHVNSDEPEWLAFVPRSLQAPDVDEAIMRGSGCISRYDTADGGVVYTGMAWVGLVSAGIATPHRRDILSDSSPKRN
jgi:hypothetical protein